MTTSRTPGQRAGLTRARVLAAAHEVLGELGLSALTMRALAQRLEVAPNALYSHVPSKAALIDEILDDVLVAVRAPTSEVEQPDVGLHTVMASTYEVLLAHRDLVPVYLARQGARGPNAQRLGDVMLGLLARAGVSTEESRPALSVLIVYTIGFAAFATHQPIGAGGDPEQMRASFDSGLRWLLAGILATTSA